jgi:hypothetical protein
MVNNCININNTNNHLSPQIIEHERLIKSFHCLCINFLTTDATSGAVTAHIILAEHMI